MSDEIKMINQELDNYYTVFNKIPVTLLDMELDNYSSDFLAELNQIIKYYGIYKNGAKFTVEGSNGDYVPAQLRYKMSANLIDKEARFLFAECPDLKVEPKGDVGRITDEAINYITTLNDLIKTVLDENKFEQQLLKAAKDCFIGKRVACVVNFNEDDGVTISFIPSTNFIFETKTGNNNVLTKFVCFSVLKDSANSSIKRIFRKRYILENDGFVYFEEHIFDGNGYLIEEITPYQATLLNIIPASVIINDGLTGDEKGESEIDKLSEFEAWFSRLSSADIDAQRKSMNPTKYVVDMASNSTKNLSTSAGALWDLGTDQNLEKASPQVGLLEPSMHYSEALKTSLDRIKTTGYECIDMPNITLESLQGAITSGKSLKAIYWPLIVRCKEKMQTWGPQLRLVIDIIIKGAMVYPDTVKRYITDTLNPVDYEIVVEQNLPLPEDEQEEKTIDLEEVAAQTMSKKSYMKKWRNLTDEEADEELKQIAYEREIIEDSFSGGGNTETDETEINENETVFDVE